MAETKRYPVLAVDLGGTKMVSALVDSGGKIRDRYLQETNTSEGPEVVVDRLFSGMDSLLGWNNLTAGQLNSISIAAAAIINIKNGIATEGPNLPGWRDVPLRNLVRDRFGIETYLVNDADAAALGEQRFGAGKGCDNLVLLTLGTGVGGGIIIGGKLYTGTSASAAEIGHMTLVDDGPQCACGKRGCLESLVSGSAIAREARTRIADGEKSLLVEMAGDNPDSITAEEVHLAAENGDSLALDIIAKAAYYLGLGVLNIVNLLNPDMVIIGGSVAQMGDLLLNPVRQMVKEKAFPVMAANVQIVTAQLGNDAGLVGAAIYALER